MLSSSSALSLLAPFSPSAPPTLAPPSILDPSWASCSPAPPWAVEILLSLLSGVETPVTHHKAHWGRAREKEGTEQNHCIPQKERDVESETERIKSDQHLFTENIYVVRYW
ncbi:hypothetical protein DPX16_8771 [Anabarilius grahami]|uniref:Uncharacterized protein n=1 Tax=Anabarilius grahami TaxID=495550 RepID=A0A3N0YDP6_ANAGA|nr:hypothetical protein DPX16_8771 [Anabarilius grahami]